MSPARDWSTTPTSSDPWTPTTATTGTITISYASDDLTTGTTAPTTIYRTKQQTRYHPVYIVPARHAAVAPAPVRLENEGWGVRKEASLAALDGMVRRARHERQNPKEAKARWGFQQMCRIPCYRGVRTR